MAEVVVIGGGFGGLASALRLAKLGHRVSLVEPGPLGGALVPVTAEGFTWDTVSHTLLPAVVRDLFHKTGRPLERELELTPLEQVRQHRFGDGSRLDLGSGRAAQVAAFDALGPGLGQAWLAHVASYADDWEVLRRGYLETPWDPDHLPGPVAARLDARESLHRRLRRALPDPRARLVAAYPFEIDGHDLREVPAWAGITAYVEQRFGSWQVTGGTGVLLDALVRRLATRRVSVVAARATDIVVRTGRAAAVATTDGELDADVVVCTIDPRHLPALSGLVRRTTSTIPAPMCHLGLVGEVPELPREVVLHGHGEVVVRATPRDAEGRSAWTVSGRGPLAREPLDALAAHGIDMREQVVTRLDRSSAELVATWGGSPLGVRWRGRGTTRRRLGPRTPIAGVYAAGSHATPGAGLPYVGLSAALVAQVVGPAGR